MMKKRFLGILASILAGSTVLFATQAIATQETKSQAVDQYMIIDLPAVSVEWKTPEKETATSETLSRESTEETDPSVAKGLYSYLDLTDCFTNKNNQETTIQHEYTLTGICMNEAMIAYLMNEYSAYKNYGTVKIYEVATKQPAADETNLFKLLLQVEDGANIVSYSHGILLNEEETEVLIKTPEYTYLNESGNTATAIDSETNHWLIVHLAPEVSISEADEEKTDVSQTSAEDDETASESSQDVAKIPESTKAPETAPTVAPNTAANPTASASSTTPPTTAPPTTTAHTHNWVAVTKTVHHDAETTVVHHDATGHYETVVTQAAWDETVTIGYKCSGCGATK